MNRRTIPLLAFLATTVATAPAIGAELANRTDGWDCEKTAAYLDGRLDLWFSRAAKLRTGSEQTTCVSCHATFPYLLARPVLRQVMHVTNATPQEAKLLADIVRRVETYENRAPISGGKETQSIGTEAVLNALLLAMRDAREHLPQPSRSTRQAFRQLWETQSADGAWDWLDFASEPTESTSARYYGAALAALAVGTVPGASYADDAKTVRQVRRLTAYLNQNYASQSLHHKAWMLLACGRLNGLLSGSQREELIAELQRQQNADGGWSLYRLGPWRWSKTAPPYAPGEKLDISKLAQSDGYATGLIVYALRQGGMSSGSPALRKAITWLKSNQREYKADQQVWKHWHAPSLNHPWPTSPAPNEPWQHLIPSDVATAFAVLALGSVE